ncbi:UrcA family protein [Sphingomonas sp. G-3-2-10]|uniref:UrcA family protein n=1 Tax=Sphingomonas sp. G-3-2-10 TaxID=2728838 RepID=UPI00146A4FAD|nr:UrcA family protein [Sphingomonas sp. G-3-2-10]NML06961.1 UrcA family protein [Sphingomonas sp. G-3-2-10]
MKSILIALAACIAATPATAQDVPKTASVRLDDLDLSQRAGVLTLNRRVAAAKESVCGSYAGARDGEETRIEACRAAVDRQVEPRLAALARGTTLAAR